MLSFFHQSYPYLNLFLICIDFCWIICTCFGKNLVWWRFALLINLVEACMLMVFFFFFTLYWQPLYLFCTCMRVLAGGEELIIWKCILLRVGMSCTICLSWRYCCSLKDMSLEAYCPRFEVSDDIINTYQPYRIKFYACWSNPAETRYNINVG